jgi:transposase-like protein
MSKGSKTKLSIEEKRTLCESWQRSGLSQSVFCRQHGIAHATFHRWRVKFLAEDNNAEIKSKLQLSKKTSIVKKHSKTSQWSPAISTSKEAFLQEQSTVEVKLANQIILRFSIQLSSIKTLVQELSNATTIIR